MVNRPLKNVGEAAETRQKQAKKRSLRAVNEHFEPVFNAVSATQVVFQWPVKLLCATALLISCWLSSALALADMGSAITVEATALRASASNGAASLQELAADTRLRILKRQGGWYQVQTTSGQQGWLALLTVRFDKSAGAKSGNISELLQGSTAVQPASSVATGVRGVTEDQLEAAAGASSAQLQALERYAVTPSRARAFAQSGGLRSQTIAYPADAK